MEWKGKELRTNGDLMTDGIEKCNSPEEAKEFMKIYFAENVHAYSNISYLAGYYSEEMKHRIFEWFECAHPIFGTRDPTPEEALNAGKRLAKKGV